MWNVERYFVTVVSSVAKSVYSVETVPELAESAAQRLQQQGYDNVRVKTGDGSIGWLQHAPHCSTNARVFPDVVLDGILCGTTIRYAHAHISRHYESRAKKTISLLLVCILIATCTLFVVGHLSRLKCNTILTFCVHWHFSVIQH